jgi:site-specific recombinase XerD
MSTILFSDLLRETKLALSSFNYKESVFKRYEIEFYAVLEYFSNCGETNFSIIILEEYLKKANADYNQQRISKTKYYRILRAADKLIQFYNHGEIQWKKLPNFKTKNKQEYDNLEVINSYKYYLDEKGLSFNTKKNYLRISTLFMAYVKDKGHSSLGDLNRKEVSSFIPHISQWYKLGSMSVVLTALRSFFYYIKDNNYSDWNLTLALPRKAAVKTIVYRPLTTKEEIELLMSIDRSTSVGKRDYALILLIMRTGLRTIDIINLLINDIDWRRNTITIIQKKTQRPLIVPLLPEVGNAIADYILNGRPVSDDVHLFLRSHSPYIAFQDAYSASEIIKKYIKKAGIRQQECNRNGAHSLRHSLASRLLKDETPLTIISSVLGHSNKNSTKEYLSTDLEHLRNCGLTLEGIEVTKGDLA